MSQERIHKERVLKPKGAEQVEGTSSDPRPDATGLVSLQQSIGNRAVQRLLVSRSGGDGGFDLDDETAGRINQTRGGGQPLDSAVQKQMGAALGQDFSGVRVHTGSESDDLNRQLQAKAFTSGQDVFFRQGSYEPGSDSGRELIAHELTHVVQQGSGAVSGGQKMAVNPPGDVYEQEADSIASQVKSAEAAHSGAAQRREAEKAVQAQALQRQVEGEGEKEEEEPVQTQALQRQVEGEEEKEEPVQTQALQRQVEGEEEKEEPVQTQALQRQDEEEVESA